MSRSFWWCLESELGFWAHKNNFYTFKYPQFKELLAVVELFEKVPKNHKFAKT
jgi:hypothetical protein